MRKTVMIVVMGLMALVWAHAQQAPEQKTAGVASAKPTVITPAVPNNVQDEYARRVIEILRLELQAKNTQSQALAKNDELRTYLQGQMEKVCGVGGTFTENAGKLACLPVPPPAKK